MAPRRHNIGASRRRRRDEEGEDEGSLDGELEDDSLSEGSVISHPDEDDADGEGSDESDNELRTSSHPHTSHPNGRMLKANHKLGRRHSSSPAKRLIASTVSDTEAMMNGMKLSEEPTPEAGIHFDDLEGELGPPVGRTPSAPPSEPRREAAAEVKRREQEKHTTKDKDANPALVPSRGSFFLHDKRSTETVTNGHKTSMKSKTRPYGLIVDGNVRRHNVKPDTSEGQWAHDLHDTVAGGRSSTAKVSTASTGFSNYPPRPVPTAPRSSPPNRSFSSTTLLGNVPVVVLLPGMDRPISYPSVSKKQHTRLPQHRPPLRRDKPVRISLPGQPPRYIFPAIERSFIFIPRALRPNQQAFRGRRGGFMTGRRPSIYAGSTYAPSVSISRRSSLGKPPSQEGWHSPAGSVFSRHTIITTENGKPVVRLPPPRPPLGIPHVPAGPVVASSALPPPLPPQPQPRAYRESRPAPIPMHQPRPQKAVSVADIETPASFPFNTPQPQQEQPFHHQVPMPANGPVYGPEASTHVPPAHASATPVSHIPDRAIHAQPFQPYGFQQAQIYYPASYPAGAVYYPNSGTDYAPFNGAGGPGASAPPFPQGQHGPPYMVPPAPSSGEQASQPGTVAHEAGGTVYFYDANQMYPNSSYGLPSAPGPGGVVGMGGMLTPPGATYYYPQSQNGVYYSAQ
ncbi:uncharacterized protein BO97DRAFT_276895 [Aspergillus homomorphus CBS 101889]|uniref:Btz domain-containing protein n=1 Tax=Aspergillus homomorphus (strain CBS 101889) TaxID=1450537 RepID=A0A395HHA8_ASPHC|nr:hypothetical protein BO97DRAFT_276895 [Aspergillus homomorphus CBS 101889]RAL06883.1 hypothetical protein BO97DRAFT_276895 [Aspergillus homomorphus CBS 101889]